MANFVKTIEDLKLNTELSEKLAEVIKAAELTGKVGAITIQLKFKTKGNTGQIEIQPIIKANIPEYERGTAIMFATSEGNLQLNDPRQLDLPLKQVEQAETPKTLKIAGAK
ncbi:hypothetical protein [Neisseria weixii]|uniref:hypothetical protein n=1 Tax=Neisseria weixii TaxID=1853276 RepID=UPI0035A06B11